MLGTILLFNYQFSYLSKSNGTSNGRQYPENINDYVINVYKRDALRFWHTISKVVHILKDKFAIHRWRRVGQLIDRQLPGINTIASFISNSGVRI